MRTPAHLAGAPGGGGDGQVYMPLYTCSSSPRLPPPPAEAPDGPGGLLPAFPAVPMQSTEPAAVRWARLQWQRLGWGPDSTERAAGAQRLLGEREVSRARS